MEKIQVGYSRKESTDDYGSVGISGLVEFVPESDNLQEEYDSMFVYLKTVVDQKVEIVTKKPVEQTGHIAATPQAEETTQVKDEPEPVEDKTNPGGVAPKGVTKEQVFLSNAKVFRSNVKKARNGKIYGELRVGHDDLEAHLPTEEDGTLQHYVTVKVWEPEEIAKIGSRVRMKNEDTGEVEEQERLLLNKEDFVDLWGTFKPWQSDGTGRLYDLHASSLKKHE